MNDANGKGGGHVAIELAGKGPAHATSLARVQSSASILRTIEKANRVVISFSNVCAWVPTLVVPGRSNPLAAALKPCLKGGGGGDGSQQQQQQPPKERQILFNISGEINPGEVLALMGPSGGGKTSLLALLGGRSTARLEGSIAFNGAPMTKATKRKLGYVMQDDLLYAELTVYETLYFAALLRLPRAWSRADKLARVDMVIAGLGLERCRHTIIGSHMMRGVSGGERKRVSIGHELLINPSMLLLDEPTSGLDSTTALRLMHTLRSLARGGRTIVTSIHQPSSRLYGRMDKLMLLSEGRCMYYGDASAVAPWFRSQGQPCPFGTNIADHILDLANGDVLVAGGAGGPSGPGAASASAASGLALLGGGGDAAEGAGGGAAAKGGEEEEEGEGANTAAEVHRRLVGAYEERSYGRGPGGIRTCDFAGEGEDGEEGLRANGTTNGKQIFSVMTAPNGNGINGNGINGNGPMVDAGEEGEGDDGKWGASWVDQIKYLTVRCVKTRRFTALSHQKCFQLLAVAALAGMFWWQIGADLDSTQAVLDVGGLLFFIELFMGFATLFAALFTFPSEFQMLVKERQSGMYRLSAFYAARTLSDLPMDCLLPSLFVWIIYFMAGLRLDAGAFFAHWASVLLVVLTSQSVGLLIGATVINPQNGQTIATIFMLSTMLVGGYYVRGIPVWIAWLKYVSFIYWGWNLLLKVEFSGRDFPCDAVADATGQPAPPGPCDVAQADAFLIDVDAPVTQEVCVLVGMLIFLRLCIYYALSYKTTFRGRR